MPPSKTILRYLISCLLFGIVYTCHYSCLTCCSSTICPPSTTSPYVSCTSCYSGKQVIDKIDRNSNSVNVYQLHTYTGVCSSDSLPNINPLGIVILCLIIIAYSYCKSTIPLMVLDQLQNISLLGLLQINLVPGVNYLFDALHYLLPITRMGKGVKTPTTVLLSNQNYKLQRLFGTSQLLYNTSIINTVLYALLILSVAVLVVNLVIKRFSLKSANSRTPTTNTFYLENESNSFLNSPQTILKWLDLFFYFTIIEQVMGLVLGFMRSGLNSTSYSFSSIVIFFVLLCLYVVRIYNYPSYIYSSTANKALNYTNLVEKIVISAIVCMAGKHQFLYILPSIMLSFQASKILIAFKFSQSRKTDISLNLGCICVILQTFVYIAVENNINSERASTAAGVFWIISIAVFASSILLQLGYEAFVEFVSPILAKKREHEQQSISPSGSQELDKVVHHNSKPNAIVADAIIDEMNMNKLDRNRRDLKELEIDEDESLDVVNINDMKLKTDQDNEKQRKKRNGQGGSSSEEEDSDDQDITGRRGKKEDEDIEGKVKETLDVMNLNSHTKRRRRKRKKLQFDTSLVRDTYLGFK